MGCCCCLLFSKVEKLLLLSPTQLFCGLWQGEGGSLLVQVMCFIQLPNNQNRSLGVNVTSVLHVQTGIWQIMQHSRHNSNSNNSNNSNK